MGVKRVCVPNRSTKSAERKRERRKLVPQRPEMANWMRGANQCRQAATWSASVRRYKGFDGMQRWVGLGVIAGNLINIGRALEAQS
jgi:hypothetical protein